jgi:hypothetical protein
MTWLALAALLQPVPAPAPSWYGGRLLTTPALHLGLRPAGYVDDEGDRGALEWGVGLTVQVTVRAP